MLRLLLDHNFPPAPFAVHELDRTVSYEPLGGWHPEFAEVSTPDWVIHLQAYADGFDGVVTADWHQLEQHEEVIALDQTRLSVITWRKGLDDPIQQWGSLLVYMPQIRHKIEHEGPSVIRLPVPQLQPDNVEAMRGISNRYASEKAKLPRATLVKETLPDMLEVLRERGLEHLAPILEGPRPRRAKPKIATPAKKRKPRL